MANIPTMTPAMEKMIKVPCHRSFECAGSDVDEESLLFISTIYHSVVDVSGNCDVHGAC